MIKLGIGYISAGMIIGLAVYHFWFASPVSERVPVDQSFESVATIQGCSDDRLASIIRNSMRDEMAEHMSAIHVAMNELKSSHSPDHKTEANNPAVQQGSSQITHAYESANEVIEDVISVGTFDSYSAKAFIEHVKALPHDQAMALRAKHMDAVNRGLMSSPNPPEEYLYGE